MTSYYDLDAQDKANFAQLWPERAAILESPLPTIAPPPALSADPWTDPEIAARIAREALPLNGDGAFSLLKADPYAKKPAQSQPASVPAEPVQAPMKKPAAKGIVQRLRGFDIRYQRTGDDWMSQKAHGFAIDGTLPTEWEMVTSDPTVIKAVIFPSTQRTWQAQRRKLVAQYERKAS